VLAVEARVNGLNRALRGDNTLSSRNEGVPPSISDRVNDAVGDLWSSTSTPSATHVRGYEIAGEEFAPLLADLKQLVSQDLKRIEDAMEAAGAPWTPGRLPDWEGH